MQQDYTLLSHGFTSHPPKEIHGSEDERKPHTLFSMLEATSNTVHIVWENAVPDNIWK